MNGYVQTQCPRCGNAAWGHPAQAVPCNSCGDAVSLQAAPMPAAMPPPMAPQGWGQVPGMGMGGGPGMSIGGGPGMGMGGGPGMGMGGGPGMGSAPGMQVAPGGANPWSSPPVSTQGASAPAMGIPLPGGYKLPFNLTGAGGGISKFKVIGGVMLVIVLGVGGLIFKLKFVTPKGMISYSALGLEKGKPDPDKMIASTGAFAKKWKKDAIFWSVNYQAVRADGTVDVSKGAEVVFTSPGSSASYAKSQRSDSIKKYRFSTTGVNAKGKYFWNDRIEEMKAPPVAKCTIKDVVALLTKEGLTAGKTVRITFDPKFADSHAWHVLGDDPKINAHYAWEDCSLIK